MDSVIYLYLQHIIEWIKDIFQPVDSFLSKIKWMLSIWENSLKTISKKDFECG